MTKIAFLLRVTDAGWSLLSPRMTKKAPVAAPVTAEASKALTPKVIVEAPKVIVEAPIVPVDAPIVPVEAPIVPVEAPIVPVEAPIVPVEAPKVPVEAPVAVPKKEAPKESKVQVDDVDALLKEKYQVPRLHSRRWDSQICSSTCI